MYLVFIWRLDLMILMRANPLGFQDFFVKRVLLAPSPYKLSTVGIGFQYAKCPL